MPHRVVASLCSPNEVQKPLKIHEYKMQGNRNVQKLHCFLLHLDNNIHELTSLNPFFKGKKRLQVP